MNNRSYQAAAQAILRGNSDNPDITGSVSFTPTPDGVLVIADVRGLPVDTAPCAANIHALHIHGGTSCGGVDFADANGHYNPKNCPHPAHAGDLPPLFASSGRAFSGVLTDRFTLNEILGHVVIIHRNADDFTTQPSGNAGPMIACGVISPIS